MTAEPARETIKFKKRTSKKRLNKRTIDALKSPAEKPNGKPAQEWHYDQTTARLSICVWSTGAKTWYWVGRLKHGGMIRYRLGNYPETTPDQAKGLAADVSRDVIKGIDPRDNRKRQREEPTLGELWEWYLEHHARPRKKPKSIKEDERLYKSHLSPWKARRLSTIKQSHVRTLHATIGRNRKYEANRMLSLLGAMFSKGIDADDMGFEGPNPARGVDRFPEEERDRFLHPDEVGKFFEALEKQPPLMRDYFKLALFTGARRGNVQAMRWAELNLERGEWRLPDTKANEAQTVYLSTEAVGVLRTRQGSAESEYVFPSRAGAKFPHITDPYKAWKRICDNAGMKGIRPHDLRRSLGSWQAMTGASLPTIGKSLGHKNQSTTAIYARMNLDPVRAAVELATAAMLAAAKPKEDNQQNAG